LLVGAAAVIVPAGQLVGSGLLGGVTFLGGAALVDLVQRALSALDGAGGLVGRRDTDAVFAAGRRFVGCHVADIRDSGLRRSRSRLGGYRAGVSIPAGDDVD